jgi:6-phosphogluconolactonase
MDRLVEHDSREALAEALAEAAAAALRAALEARGRAGLVVPGGDSPRDFLTALGAARLDWGRIWVAPTDERWVPPSDPRSNQRMLGETLFRGPAAAAEFAPLYGGTAEPADGLPAVAAGLERLGWPPDAAVFGLGTDGHVAGLKPDADRLAEALDPAAPARALALRAPGEDFMRVTLTARALAEARRRWLIVLGAEKRAALERGGSALDSLRRAPGGVEVHFAA